MNETKPRALELFAGIGGFSAAAEGSLDVVAALDASPHTTQVYRLNFGEAARQYNLQHLAATTAADFQADFWWLSPPCRPFTVRGAQKDIDDPRARPLLNIIELIAEVEPAMLALENVEPFAESRARNSFVGMLADRGYDWAEHVICPTELGVPSRRPRYYLTASKTGLRALEAPPQMGRALAAYLDAADDDSLLVPDEVMARYGTAFRTLERDMADAYTTCFTAGYAQSWSYTGSYLRTLDGRVRRFSPEEVVRLLHFPASFRFPREMAARTRWRFAGNSLSVAAVRWLLRSFPELDPRA